MHKLPNGNYEVSLLGLIIAGMIAFLCVIGSVVLISILPSLIPFLIVCGIAAFIRTKQD